MGSDENLNDVLADAAALAAELAREIGEPVPSALAEASASTKVVDQVASLEGTEDLDSQLANLQQLVSDAAAGVETDEDIDSIPSLDPVESDAGGGSNGAGKAVESAAQPAGGTPESESCAVSPQTDAATSPASAVGDVQSKPGVVTGGPPGVVGNVKKDPPANEASPETQAAGTDNAARNAQARGIGRGMSGLGLRVGELGVRFLELIDEPFERIGGSLRQVIGWVAIASVGTAIIVAIISVL